jgi:hypothetical protein
VARKETSVASVDFSAGAVASEHLSVAARIDDNMTFRSHKGVAWLFSKLSLVDGANCEL